MPVDYYTGKSVDELLAILSSLQDRNSGGGSIIEVTAAGIKTVRAPGGVKDNSTDTEILRVLYSLFLRLPEVYPNPYASRIRRTDTSYAN